MSEPIADQVNPTSFSIKAVDKGPESLSLQIWGGKLGFNIFANKQTIWKKNATPDIFILFKKSLVGILSAQPGSRRAITISDWDDNAKKPVPGSTMVIGKDDRNVIYIEIQFKDRGNAKSVKFDLLSSPMVSVGSEPMSPADRSSTRAEGLIDWLTYYYPAASVLTSRKFKRGGGGGNSGGGGGGGNFNNAPSF